MSLIPLGRQGAVVAIEKAYPIYHGNDACITLAVPGCVKDGLWKKRRLATMPFLHRLCLMPTRSGSVLVAASLAGRKNYQEDWECVGKVYAGRISSRSARVKLVPIFDGLSRNHGMHVANYLGRRTLFVSGMEGLFGLCPQSDPLKPWKQQHLLQHDVSDVAVFDFDGDGHAEFVTIEPFHGNRFALYQRNGDGLSRCLEIEGAFGHVVWAGIIRNRRCLILGNRGGRRDLRLLTFRGDGSLRYIERTLDEGGGPANIVVVQGRNRDLILSANHVRGEVCLYELT